MSNFPEQDTNLFPLGGLLYWLPAAYRGAKAVRHKIKNSQRLRDRMYRTVEPTGYTYDNMMNFIKGDRRSYSDPNTEGLFGKYTGQDSIIASYSQAPKGLPDGRHLTSKEVQELGFPFGENKDGGLAKYAVKDIVVPSKSKPGAYELAYPNQEGNIFHLPQNSNELDGDRWMHSHQLGTFHQTKGQDENGTYISYEDTWDINPFRGKSSEDDPSWKGFIETGKTVGLDKIGDVLPFGEPFEIYGKQYYDKNGKPVNKKDTGGPIWKPTYRDAWDRLSLTAKSEMMKVAVKHGITDLQEIKKRYNEFAEGGKIYIKPENRGKFTALKERTGHSATWFKEHGTPAQKKMATFELNAAKWHGDGGNLFGDGGDETAAFTPIANPIIPKVPEDQASVNWIANWYNNRREQLYNNARSYNRLLTIVDNAKDKRFGLPVGKSTADREYYEKLNNMANYRTSTFDELQKDEPDVYNNIDDNTAAYTSQQGTIYYNEPYMEFVDVLNNGNVGYSQNGIHIHERTHASGKPGREDALVGYNAQTAAVKRIIKNKAGIPQHSYIDAPAEIYARMMEFRYNHGLSPKKKYTSKEIQKMLDKEGKDYNSDLQRYDVESLTKALNEVAQIGKSQKNINIFFT